VTAPSPAKRSPLSSLALSLLLVLASASCAIRGGAHGAGAERGVFGRSSERPDASRWLGGDSARAKAAGASESEVIAVEAGAAGDRISGTLLVPDQSCALLIARATDSIEDLDLFVYGDDGSLLGADEAPDKAPTLMVCPPHPRRLFVVARVASGNGLVALGGQHVAADQAPRVAQAVGARGLLSQATRSVDAWQGLDEKVAEHRRMIGARWQDVRRVAVPIDARMPTHVSAAIEPDGCLDALVIPSDEVSHLDVAALDLDGRIIGRAAAAGRERAIVVCSPARSGISVEIRPHAGRGLAAVVLSRLVPGSEHDLDAQALRFDLAPVGDLQSTRKKHELRLERIGYGRVKAKLVGEGALEIGRRASVAVDLPSGCARLDVLSGAPVRGLEAWLWAADGSLLSTDRGGSQATLFACSKGGKARLDAEAMTRPGPYAIELRAEPETPKLLDDHPLAAGRLLSRMTARGVIRGAAQVGAPKLVALSPTRIEHVDLMVPMGRCVDLTLALGPGASGAEIRLFDSANNRELALSRGTHSTSARACALDRAGTLNARAELRVMAGQTDALVASRMLSPRS
jgi:hypothetical protein